jgi:hypothetical protein
MRVLRAPAAVDIGRHLAAAVLPSIQALMLVAVIAVVASGTDLLLGYGVRQLVADAVDLPGHRRRLARAVPQAHVGCHLLLQPCEGVLHAGRRWAGGRARHVRALEEQGLQRGNGIAARLGRRDPRRGSRFGARRHRR